MEIETSPVVEKEQPQITWSTPEEARQAFEALLKETIQTPSMTWKEAVPLLTKDIRFTVGTKKENEKQAIEKTGQKKQIFSEFMNRMVKAKKEERIKQTIQYKESFIKLLKNCKDITAESTARQVEQLLGNTEAWQKMDAKERDDEVYSYLRRLKQMEREVRDGGKRAD